MQTKTINSLKNSAIDLFEELEEARALYTEIVADDTEALMTAEKLIDDLEVESDCAVCMIKLNMGTPIHSITEKKEIMECIRSRRPIVGKVKVHRDFAENRWMRRLYVVNE